MILSIRYILLSILLFPAGSTMSAVSPEGRNKGRSDACGNFLIIEGESNINRFSFSFATRPDDPATSFNYRSLHNGTEIMIPVREFEASNPHMYSDFLMKLHEKEFPYISIKFPDLTTNKTDNLLQRSQHKVLITIAGVTKQYSIDCSLLNCGDHLSISGSEMVRLSDFHISPPEKLNGLIKVKDEITVSFSIILNFTSDKSYAVLR
jgi:hypothetical protein